MSDGPRFPAAVLFDLDGTLIDSEPVWAQATRDLALTCGVRIREELLESISGLDATLAMRQIHEELEWADRDIAADLAFVQNSVREAYQRGFNWLPGARDLLDTVRAGGIRTGLVTSTYRPLVDIFLAALGEYRFDVVVCGDDGHEPKPSPAPYAAAAARLGVEPARCLAVEDSVRGVASARAAGCVVLHVAGDEVIPDADAHLATLVAVTAEFIAGLADAAAQPVSTPR